jgi:pimeloyl-ACP methyl ester carboxylesterase
MSEPITGTAAGVPYTALAPDAETDALIVTWHMLDAPRSNAAFAAALPLSGVPAWRVHLGMPYCGARMVDGSMDKGIELMREDPVLSYAAAFVEQAVSEFPAALAEARAQLGIGDGFLGVLGGSLGGMVVLRNLALHEIPIKAAALVNPAVRVRSMITLIEGVTGRPYSWNAESAAAADLLDFASHANDVVAAQAPVLLVSGENDFPDFRVDADKLITTLSERGLAAELTTVPGLAHPLADEPGIEPSPQWATTKIVDEAITQWFLRHLS